MPYRFATDRQDFSDYASGKVFYSRPGHPAFPVRLASEIFQRCLAHRVAQGATGPCTLYDPCCGAAYHLSTLAFLHGKTIARIIASDVDAEILPVARRNLALLTLEGLDQRAAEIAGMLAAYEKTAHAGALASAGRLRKRLEKLVSQHLISTLLFVADATDGQSLAENLAGAHIDIVLSDIPYGWHSMWRVADSDSQTAASPVWRMLEALAPTLTPDAVAAIASDKGQRIAHEGYRRIEQFQIGKRRVALLQPVS